MKMKMPKKITKVTPSCLKACKSVFKESSKSMGGDLALNQVNQRVEYPRVAMQHPPRLDNPHLKSGGKLKRTSKK
jgi:hypothetical protein